MVTILITAAAAVLTLLAELLHGLRLRRLGYLAFGPSKRPAPWTRSVPLLRALAVGALTWGLLTLIQIEGRVHRPDDLKEDEFRHLVLVLDVSPSMRLTDAGPSREQSRLHRARDVLRSMFNRIPMRLFKVSVIATYNGAHPVVIDTVDSNVVDNILGDLPMHHAFKPGETRLFDGLEEAAKIARPWQEKSTTVAVVSDGDTLPPAGMPKMPASVIGVLVIGVGDPVSGTFINGRNSKQDVSSLRQMALRLGGVYHDGNRRHVASSVLGEITTGSESSALEALSRREYALLAVGLGAALLALIPLLLHALGTGWNPGKRRRNKEHPKSPGSGPGSEAGSDDRMHRHVG